MHCYAVWLVRKGQSKNRVVFPAICEQIAQMTELTLPAARFDERAKSYVRMAQALEHLGDTWRQWPDLARIAEAIGLSPHHFQREFTRWAGISPKQFQAALAHGAAGDLLRQGASVLDTAFEIGLSGPSRLRHTRKILCAYGAGA